MTEQDWLACADLRKMLAFLRGKVSDRKLRLFACACYRRGGHTVSGLPLPALEAAELYADGVVGAETLWAAYAVLPQRVGCVAIPREFEAEDAWSVAWWAGLPEDQAHQDPAAPPLQDWPYARNPARPNGIPLRAGQCELLRDILGHPFRRAAIDPGWLRWSQGTVQKLARTIYQSRDYRTLVVLADALEEAGCTNSDILTHCRSPGPHIRGCWLVDVLLAAT
jgi:hypothetical protein